MGLINNLFMQAYDRGLKRLLRGVFASKVELSSKQDAINDLATIRSGAAAGATAVQPSVMNTALVNTVAESGVYDVTANNSGATFASLIALLSAQNLDTLIPVAKRKGGMSIKFVQSSDNKYVQCRLTDTSFTTDVNKWVSEQAEIEDLQTKVIDLSGGDKTSEETKSVVGREISFTGYGFQAGDVIVVTLLSDGATNHDIVVQKNSGAGQVYGHIRSVGGSLTITLTESITSLYCYNSGANTNWSCKMSLTRHKEGRVVVLEQSVDDLEQTVGSLDQSVDDCEQSVSNMESHVENMYGEDEIYETTKNVTGRTTKITSDMGYNIGDTITITLLTDGAITHDIVVSKDTETGTLYGHIRAIDASLTFTLTTTATSICCYNNGANTNWSCKMSQLRHADGRVDNLEQDVENINTQLTSFLSFGGGDKLVKLSATNPIEKVRYDCGLLAIFKTVGIIGDSLASGEMQGFDANGNMVFEDMYEFSWGQQIAKMTGVDVYNFSQGGQYAKGWMTGNTKRTWDAGDVAGGAHSNKKQCYYIGLAHNDKTMVENNTYTAGIGTVADINDADYEQNADSYVGWYARIIQAIKSIEPRAYIFCITPPLNTQYAAYSEQIRNIVEHFAGQRVYLIDIATYGNSGSSLMWMNSHLSAAGYLYFAYLIANYTDYLIRTNAADFRYTSLVGTDIIDTLPNS